MTEKSDARRNHASAVDRRGLPDNAAIFRRTSAASHQEAKSADEILYEGRAGQTGAGRCCRIITVMTGALL